MKTIHETADGRRLLGAAWRPLRRRDRLCQMAGPCRRLGLWHGAAGSTTCCSRCAAALGLPYWSLSAFLKHKVKNAVEYISRFEEIVAREAERAASTAWCAAISITPKSAGSAGSSTSMTETGLKAAPPLSKMPREIWRFFAGQTLTRDTPQDRRAASRPWLPDTPRPRLYPRRSRRLEPGPLPGVAAHFENHDRHRCLDTPGQWRRAHAGDAGQGSWQPRPYACATSRRLAGAPFRCPPIREIRLALFPARSLTREIKEFAPDAMHIATEGSLGLTRARICLKHGIAFTTSFHTRFRRICPCALSA